MDDRNEAGAAEGAKADGAEKAAEEVTEAGCGAKDAPPSCEDDSVKKAGEEGKSEGPLAPVMARGLFGGLLMGLANLVPGISGGTMLLASGVYQHFVNAIAELTRLKFRLRSIAVLGAIVAMAAVSILLFAGPVKTLVVEHRWVMYSLFIGLTLGGVPVLWKLVGKPDVRVWVGAACGLALMVVVAYFQMKGAGDGEAREIPWAMYLLGGILGASAMVLPGISGGYLLLLLGQYVSILGGIDAFKGALLSGDIQGAMTPAISILLPVGLGVLAGIAGVSNLLKFLFARFEKATLGVLLGFLVGAVVGLWPFQEGVRPAVGFVFKGRKLVTEAEIDAIKANWPTDFFTPSVGHVAGAIALVAAGFALTILVDWVGSRMGTSGKDGGEAGKTAA